MERYLQIGKINLTHNVLWHLLACALLLCASPLVLGTSNLGERDTAKVLEMFVALIGIIMIPSVFLPEQNRDIRELIRSKYTGCGIVYGIRLMTSVLILAALLGIYVWILARGNCRFPVAGYYCGTLAEMLFLGGLGLFFYGLSDNLVIGYMIPFFYYIVAIGSGDKYLRMFYPFSMQKGSYDEKYYLLAGAVIMISAGVCLRCRRN